MTVLFPFLLPSISMVSLGLDKTATRPRKPPWMSDIPILMTKSVQVPAPCLSSNHRPQAAGEQGFWLPEIRRAHRGARFLFFWFVRLTIKVVHLIVFEPFCRCVFLAAALSASPFRQKNTSNYLQLQRPVTYSAHSRVGRCSKVFAAPEACGSG